MADEKEPESEGGWGIAETVGWLRVGEPEADVAPPPKHQIVQANRAIGALLKDKDTLSEDLKSAQKLVETKDAEVAELRLELERRDRQLASLRELLGQGLDMCAEEDPPGDGGM